MKYRLLKGGISKNKSFLVFQKGEEQIIVLFSGRKPQYEIKNGKIIGENLFSLVRIKRSEG